MNEDEWVEIENFPTPISAELSKSKLQLSGIESEIFDGIHANMMWLHTNAIGGVKLKVRRKDLESARQVLDEETDLDETVVSPETEILEGMDYCPACHSTNVAIVSTRNTESGLGVSKWWKRNFGYRRELRCGGCGKEWKS